MSMLVMIWGRDTSTEAKDNFFSPGCYQPQYLPIPGHVAFGFLQSPRLQVTPPHHKFPSRPAECTKARSSQSLHAHHRDHPHPLVIKPTLPSLVSLQIQGLHRLLLLPSPLVSWWPGSTFLSLSLILPAILLNDRPCRYHTRAITSAHPAHSPAVFSQSPAPWCWQTSVGNGAPWQAGGISVGVENRTPGRLQPLKVTRPTLEPMP